MPIRPEFRHFYCGAAWREVRERIRARAHDACERCHKPNGVQVETAVGKVLSNSRLLPYMFWRIPGSSIWHSHKGTIKSEPYPAVHDEFRQRGKRIIRANCGAAHLNQVPGDDRDDNLAWLCDWCHWHFDQEQRHMTRSVRKDKLRPILTAVEGAA